jgi:hypothetical protein
MSALWINTSGGEEARLALLTPVAQAVASLVIDLLRRTRLPVDTETALQLEIGKLLRDNGIKHEPEVKVAGGRIDFLVGYGGPCGPKDPCVGIECKIKGGKRAIHRQVEAYCRDPRISHLIVVTGVALALPATLCGKPVTIIHVGRAWL